MIEILPMKNREKEKELLLDVEIKEDSARVISMTDRDEILGYVVVELAERELKILRMFAQNYDFLEKPGVEQIFVLDSLMRAAASYGENFGANKIVTGFPDFFDFFKIRGFETDEAHACAPMNTIVRYE